MLTQETEQGMLHRNPQYSVVIKKLRGSDKADENWILDHAWIIFLVAEALFSTLALGFMVGRGLVARRGRKGPAASPYFKIVPGSFLDSEKE